MSPMPTKMFVTGDCVAARCASGSGLEVLLVQRSNEPYKGCWALPGGFVEEDEDLKDAAARELEEETGVMARVLDEFGAWGKPGRDPRGRTVTIAYLAVVGPDSPREQAGDDAAVARWFSSDDLPPLAFDHAEIASAGLEHLRRRLGTSHLAFAFLAEQFSVEELRNVLAEVLGDKAAAFAADAPEWAQVTRQQGGDLMRCAAGDFLQPLARALLAQGPSGEE